MEFKNFSDSNILRFRLEGTLIITPTIKDELEKILSKKQLVDKQYTNGERKYFARITFSLDDYKEEEGLECKILFFNRPPFTETNQAEIFDKTLKFLEQNTVKINEANVSAIFKYTLQQYDSLISLPLSLPLPPLTESDQAEIHGIRFDLTDSEVGRYSHSIDLYGPNIFHDISFTLVESLINTLLFDELLLRLTKLSFKLVTKKAQ